jgi:hypothetical protein
VTTTRIITNAGSPLTKPDGLPLAFVQVSFLLSSITATPCDVFDAVTGERVVGSVTAVTDASGVFSVALWPNDRGSIASQYVCAINYPGAGSFGAGVPSGSTPLTWLQFKTSGLPVTPQIVTALTAYIAQMDADVATALAQANIATAEAAIATADVALTHADVVLTHADVVLTHADVVSTHADVALTHTDVSLTHADVILTDADVAAAAASAASAASNAALLSAALATFRSKWLGSFATDPAVDGNGNALATGVEYFNSVENKLRVYGATGWADYDDAAQTETTNAALSAVSASSSASAAANSLAAAVIQAALATSNGQAQVSLAAAQAVLATTNGAAQVTLAIAQAVAAANSATSSATSATASASSAAQAVIAQTLAQAAWAASTAPTERIAAVSKTFFTNSAIVAAIIYDTRKDSDGGAWRNRCQATSWYNETIYGVYRGERATEAACRAISGATTNDFFHNTTDGKFYALNATSGVTEVFRGGRSEFPEIVAITINGNNAIVWDLTDSSVPMWIVIPITVGGGWVYFGHSQASSITAINGAMLFGTQDGVVFADMIRDRGRIITGSASYGGWDSLPLSMRNATLHTYAQGTVVGLPAIANSTVNSIAATVLPNAPIDPATGLPVPTIAVFTAGGVSVIKDDGTVVNSANASSASFGGFYKNGDLLWSTGAGSIEFFAASPISAGFGGTRYNGGNATIPATSGLAASKRIALASYLVLGSAILEFIKENPTTPSAGMVAAITNTYNTGWMNGDIRLAALADTVAETVGGANLIAGDSANFNGGTVGSWSAPYLSAIAVVANQLVVTATGTNPYAALYSIHTTIGKAYRVSIDAVAKTAGVTNVSLYIGNANGLAQSQYGIIWLSLLPVGAAFIFIATTTTLCLQASATCAVGDTFTIDNISVIECAADRSVKANPLTVVGGLTKSAVNTNSQLVAWSGFSTANYLLQPYSANLDFGTGDFCYAAWIDASSGNQVLFSRGSGTTAGSILCFINGGGTPILFYIHNGTSWVQFNSGNIPPTKGLYMAVRRSGVLEHWFNGAMISSVACALTVTNTTASLMIGNRQDATQGNLVFSALFRATATAPSVDQIAYIYETERKLFEPNAKCTIDGISTAVTTLAYDEVTDLLDVGTSWGRSTFKGLVRQSSEATTNGSAVAYAAYDGNQITVGTTGAKLYIPSKYLRDELNRAAEQKKQFGQQLVKKTFVATSGQTVFIMGMNEVVSSVYQQGLLKDESAGAGFYSLSFDGFRWSITLGTGATTSDRITVFYTKVLP